MSVRPPAPRPCESCPYRQDVPSGVWDESEYERLAEYDKPTGEQPPGVFLCHQHGRDEEQARVCSGWAGCHDGDELLALRIAVFQGHLTPETAEAVRDYVSPVPLFGSGAEAATHGMRQVEAPGPDAVKVIRKVRRVRSDVV